MGSLSTETIAALFTGLTGLVAGMGGFNAFKTKGVAQDQKTLKEEVRKLQRQVIAQERHLFKLEQALATHGLEPPPRPAELLDTDK